MTKNKQLITIHVIFAQAFGRNSANKEVISVIQEMIVRLQLETYFMRDLCTGTDLCLCICKC